MPAHRTKEKKGIVATESRHTLEGMARGEKEKKKPPKKKKPPTKKEKTLLAAPLAYGRLRRHLTLSSRLSQASPSTSSYGGFAATF